MALNENTKRLIEENKDRFEQDPPKFTTQELKLSPIEEYEQYLSGLDVDVDLDKFEGYLPTGSVDPINVDIFEQRAEGQSGWELAGKALGQTASEITLGTIEGLGYLIDVPGIINAIRGEEEEFDNWFSKIARDAKEHVDEEWLPIYQTRAAQRGDFFDATSFASNFKTLGSTASLMIPSMAAGRAFGALGKMAKLGVRGTKLASSIGAGLTSRAIEATMEARGQLEGAKKRYSDQGLSESQAEVKAVEEAQKVFNGNMALAALDALQYAPIFNSFPKLSSTSKFGKAFLKTGELAYQAVTEGAEEGYQSVVGKEAQYAVENNRSMFGEDFSYRLGEYADDADFKTSIYWGALGGGVFHVAAPLAKKVVNSSINMHMNMVTAASFKNPEKFNRLTQEKKMDIIVNNAVRGNFNNIRENLNTLSGLEESEFEGTEFTKEEFDSKIQDFSTDLDFAEQQLESVNANPLFKNNEAAKKDYLLTSMEHRFNAGELSNIESELSDAVQNSIDANEIKPELRDLKLNTERLNSLKRTKEVIKKDKRLKKEAKEDILKKMDTRIKATQEVIKEQTAAAKESLGQDIDINSNLSSSTDNIIREKSNKFYELEAKQDYIIKPRLASLNTAAEISRIQEESRKKAEEINKKSAKEDVDNARSPEELQNITDANTGTNREEATNDAIQNRASDEVNTATDVTVNNVEAGNFDRKQIDRDSINDRYNGKPSLFVKEKEDLANEIVNEYGGNIPEDLLNTYETIRGAKNSSDLADALDYIATNPIPAFNRLNNIVNGFYSNLKDYNEDNNVNTYTTPDSIPEIKEFNPGSKDVANEYNISDGKIDPIAPNKASVRQYEMKKIRDTNKWTISYLDGNTVEDRVGKQLNIDWDFVNNRNNLPIGSKLGFAVNLSTVHGSKADPYHKKLVEEGRDNFINKFQILLTAIDANGNTKIVNAIPIFNPNAKGDKDKLKTLREKIWQLAKDSGQKSGMFTPNITTTLTNKSAGRILASTDVNNPHEVLNSGEELVFGIAVRKGNKIRIDAGPNVSREYNNTYDISESSLGAPYMLVKGINGNIVPVRCFTSKLRDHQTTLDKAVKLMQESDKDNWTKKREALRKFVYVDYNYNAKNDNFEVFKGVNKQNKETLTKENVEEFLRDRIVQIDFSKINTGKYNQEISEAGILKTNVKPKQILGNPVLEFSLDYVTEGEEAKVTTPTIKKVAKPVITEQPVSRDAVKPDNKLESEDSIVKPSGTAHENADSLIQALKDSVKKEIGTSPSLNDFTVIAKMGDLKSVEDIENLIEFSKNISPKISSILREFIDNNYIKTEEPVVEKPEEKVPEVKDQPKVARPPRLKGGLTINLNHGKNAKLKTVDTNKEYKKIDVGSEKKWFKKRFPNIPIEVVDGLIEVARNGGVQAWGMFSNATVYLSNVANAGTTYHEAFHAVFSLYLNADQRKQVLLEARKKYGNLSDSVLEEKLADKFREYVLLQGEDSSITGKIKRFFKNLYQIIKSRLTNDIRINDLFYRAQYGLYANKKFDRNVAKFAPTRYSIAGFTPLQQKRRVIALADIFSQVIDNVIEQNKDFESLPRKEVISALKDYAPEGSNYAGVDVLAISVYKSILKIAESKDTSESQRNEYYKMLNNFVKIEDKKVVYLSLGERALRRLSFTEGIKVKLDRTQLEDATNESDETIELEFNEEDTVAEGWQVKVEHISGKESLSKEIRKELSYIPQVDKNNNVLVDDLGFIKYHDFNLLYAYLKREMADIYDIEEMINKLETIVQSKPYMQRLLNKLNSSDLLRTKFYVDFAKSHVEYKFVVQKDGQFRVISSNRLGAKNLLIDEWKSNALDFVTNKLLNKDGSFNENRVKRFSKAWDDVRKDIRKTKVIDSVILKRLSDILNSTGINITSEDLDAINNDITTAKGEVVTGRSNVIELLNNLDVIASRFSNAQNPFEADAAETTSIDRAAFVVSSNRVELLESSFRNVENKTVYSHQIPNFLQQHLSEFRGDNYESKIKFYTDTKFYKDSPWLKELMESKQARDNFEYVEIDGLRYEGAQKGIKYTSMSAKDFDLVGFNMFFNNNSKDFAYYRMPILADAPKTVFIKFKKYSNQDIVNKLYDVVKQEWSRINDIKRREELISKGEIDPIKNYDSEKSKRFLMFPFLNSGSGRAAIESRNQQRIKEEISKWLEEESSKDFDRLLDSEVLGEKADVDGRIGSKIGDQKEVHKNYFYNSILANTQIVTLTSGDPAFYKPDDRGEGVYSRVIDFFKRAKQNVSPKLVIDLKAKYRLNKDQAAIEGTDVIEVNDTYNTIYLKDLEIPSANVEAIYDTLVNNGVSKGIAAQISGAYKKVNVTDAQAYITLPRYREIMIGLERWNSVLQDAYPRLLNGTASGEDLQLVMQPLKPFYFGHSKYENTVTPVQNKNSEYLLLPQLVNESPQLKKLYDHMINNKIGSANFESAVKSGLSGAVSLDNIENARIHSLNNKDFGLQQETPAHHIDAEGLFGTQIRKLIIADISDDAEFVIGDKTYSKQEVIDLYQSIITEDLKEAYADTAKEFSDIRSIRDLLLEEIRDRDMGDEIEEAIEIVQKKNPLTGEVSEVFNLPLFNPLYAKRFESLLNSVFKNRVTKQKIKGGPMVQLTSFGFHEDLKLKIEDGRLVEAQCMLPWWSKKLFEPILDENRQLDINKVPDNLLEMVGYRIPTEDKYSMLPLKVVGFLPASAGGAIMLPMEITTISGSD